ncbi:MAG: metapyrocatechase [Candidimonas sp.]|nr:MAG: metapyrocatechase [Candidimonas sp.]TAM19522.1 MAG: metapyrocatechase [Candidimonas sp.]TAM80161.1 MAG: metapyrocatechase [Candidimonas sp.]
MDIVNTPKVLGLNGFGLEVPDIAVARKFYTAFGLQAEDRAEALLLRSPGRTNDEIVVVKGAKKRMHHISFYIPPGSQDAFAEKIQSYGLKTYDAAPPGGVRNGLWFQDPWGTWINLNPCLPQPTPQVLLPAFNLGGRADRVDVNLWQELNKKRPPLRIGHMLIFTPDWEAAEAFFSDVLGLRPVDRVVGKGSFMAAGEGVVDHHCFVLMKSSHRGLQHASFQVASFDDIGFGAWNMREAGYKEGFGPGRHAIASNLFQYFRDPWGSWVEYYADMDKITEKWKCRDWSALPYTWGPEWSPEFWSQQMNGNFEPA